MNDQPHEEPPTQESPFVNSEEINKRQGYFLPHWTREHAIYHIVFRQGDSLPPEVLEGFKEEAKDLKARPGLTKDERMRLDYLVSDRVEAYLDAGHGSCHMKEPAIAQAVQEALQFFHGERYALHAWCVMPNHVHAIVQPYGSCPLEKILHSWKSFTAHEINARLNLTGNVWQKESYDHLIRNETSYNSAIQYVLDNPVKARLDNWKCVGTNSREVTGD